MLEGGTENVSVLVVVGVVCVGKDTHPPEESVNVRIRNGRWGGGQGKEGMDDYL